MKTKYLILFLFAFVFKTTTGFCTTHVILAGGTYPNFVFSPASVAANVGDTIDFQIGPFHFPVEVRQATWNANGNTSNGGFSLPYGGGKTVVTEAKTYYYVCGVHYAMGMKGTIVVTSATAIKALARVSRNLDVFPNPVISGVTIRADEAAGKANQIRIFDLTGKCLYKKDNIPGIQYIDLSLFSAGVYLIALKYYDIYLEKKLVISK